MGVKWASIVFLGTILSSCHSRILNFDKHNGVFKMDQEHQQPGFSSDEQCSLASENERFDCLPSAKSNQTTCEAMGCCWMSSELKINKGNDGNLKRGIDVPYCFFPKDYEGYIAESVVDTDFGMSAVLTRKTKSGWPNDVLKLQLNVYMEKMNVHFKIFDPNNARYEVPLDTPPLPSKKALSMDYTVTISKSPFSITIKRKSTGAVLFDSSPAPLVFADQFVQLSTRLSTGLLYGLGEHKDRLMHDARAGWSQRALWAHDMGPTFGANLYGSHPFYLEWESDGLAHGVFLLNSNAMDVDLQPLPALTFRTIGGILDFYVFVGPSPDDVVQQYSAVIGRPSLPPYWSLGFHLCRYGYSNSSEITAVVERTRKTGIPYVQQYSMVIGRPSLPPYWSLGFHLCRWGYGSSKKVTEVIERTRKTGIPYEVQWTDIDYMDRFLDWTYDKKRFAELPDIVKDLHNHGQKYVIIVDPGISVTQPAGTYPPYDEGVRDDVFIKNATGQILVGQVWPGLTAFPDFTHPAAPEWWRRQVDRFHNELAFDGLWTDMNEPSNFKAGSSLGCTSSSLDRPPYTPGVVFENLVTQTVCPSARQHLSSHYNLHNMYGHFEVKATQYALEKTLNKRSLVISRSTFPGTGHFGGHWSGDISSTWEDLRYSVPEMLEFQMYSIPLVGADICGFGKNTNEELCTRWMQLGSFYPFMRNHNAIHMKDQDPGVFSEAAQAAMRSAVRVRYSLLPYLYSLLYTSHVTGRPHVARPLSFQFPSDQATYAIDEQFLWGSSVLISPALYQNQTSVQAYLPAGRWYDYFTGRWVAVAPGAGVWLDLATPLAAINVHIRGGSILATKRLDSNATTTTQAHSEPFSLIVAPDEEGNAKSDVALYWDDGETIDAFTKKQVTQVWFEASKTHLKSAPMSSTPPQGDMVLDNIYVMGMEAAPREATVNGDSVVVSYNSQNQFVTLSGFRADLEKPLEVVWG